MVDDGKHSRRLHLRSSPETPLETSCGPPRTEKQSSFRCLRFDILFKFSCPPSAAGDYAACMSSADPAGSMPAGSSSSHPKLPWAFIDCSADTLVILISHMLNLLIQHNDQVILTPEALTRFHSRAAPGISVIEYLRRIVKYTNMEVGSPPCSERCSC